MTERPLTERQTTERSTSVLPTAEDKPASVEAMFDRIAGRYDLLNRLLTFRMDTGWRRAAIEALGLDGNDRARVLDLACGTGDLCRSLAAAGHAPIGADFSLGMLHAAQTTAPLVRADALRLPFADRSFDGLTCGFALRNFAALPPVLAECARVVRPGRRIALLDVATPSSPPVRAAHAVWFRKVVPFIGGLLSDKAAYAYLPASTVYLPPAPELLAMVTAAGFVNVELRLLFLGSAQLITGTRA
jgi:demethylmenaquinone methyltransferase/2-methoxy-6-polyprenyl-1,4-benzoquinol methylase